MKIDPRQVKSIFLRAIEDCTPSEWGAYLDQACGDNAELRRRVHVLLEAHQTADSLIDTPEPATTPGAGASDPDQSGTGIGPYKLIEEIGEGGMGTVYMAQQTEPVKRLVALKLIKPGMDSRQVVARFEAERQALALMDHPNIARVFDAGTTETGRPFFVMELVKGVPLTKYCDEHRLTPKERLELFIPVCLAIQHAHQKGIIHRDIKPSNVLVALYDGKPVPKVIDFGVAKATVQRLTAQTLVTGLGALVGTLEYMSPEQAELNQLDIDTRSDIYSLGVLLYELLTGTTPLDRKRLKQAAMLEVLRIIREEEPQKPSTRLSTTEELPSVAANRGLEPRKLSGLVRGELDWIVMKALEKDRKRRYETANGFAQDIQRYLADEPVQACPPSAWYGLRKFARRNKGPLLAAALVLLAMVGGIVGTTWGMMRALAAKQAEAKRALGERQAKQQALDEKAKALAAAEAEEQAKNRALDREAETKAVLDFVENKVFAAARPKDEEGGQGYDVKLADAVKAALPFVEKSFSGQPLIEARLRMTLGASFLFLGDAETAIAQYDAARKLYTNHLGPDHPATLWSMSNLANSYFRVGRTQEALKLREETLQLQKAKLGPDYPYTLWSMNNLAESYAAAGRSLEALELLEQTRQLMKAKLGPDHPDTLRSMNNLAESYAAAGRTQEAIKLHKETLQLWRAKLGPDHPETLSSMTGLANAYAATGRNPEALKLREETLQLQKAKLGPDHPDTLMSMDNLASSYIAAGRTQEAVKLHEETLRLQKAKLGPDHPHTLLSMNNLASAYRDADRTQEAIKLFEAALRLQKANLGPNHPHTLGTMNNLVNCYLAVGEGAKALPIVQDTLALRERRAKAEPGNRLEQSFLAWTHGQMGQVEQARLDYAGAVQAYARSVEMFEKLDQAGALQSFFRGYMNLYRQRLALFRKAERAVTDLEFALRQPAAEVPQLLDLRVRFLLKGQKLPAAVESAAKMNERAGEEAEQLYDVACMYALCAQAATQARSPARGAPGSGELAAEAMALLKQAVAKGYKNAAHMNEDKDLDVLRQRAEFKKLLAELKAAKKE
jgi:serine/threonine protein kinase/tetratricopeptide (TPR) repeat protein